MLFEISESIHITNKNKLRTVEQNAALFSSLKKGINRASNGVSVAVLLRGIQIQLRPSSIGTKAPAIEVLSLHVSGTECDMGRLATQPSKAVRVFGSRCLLRVLLARPWGRCVLRVVPSPSSVFCPQTLLLGWVTV